MTKAGSPKPPTKSETITLKVHIHCEGCRRKVRRIIRLVDGVEEVTVDSANGKVSVTGTADVKTILQRLQKYGKHAEVWPSSNPALPTVVKGTGVNQPKPNNNTDSDSNNIKSNNGGNEGGGKATTAAGDHGSRKGDGKEAPTPGRGAVRNELDAAVNESKPEKSKANAEEANDSKGLTQNGGSGGGGGGKKGGKKGGNGNNANNNNSNNKGNSISGGSTANVLDVPSHGPPPHDFPIMSAPNTSVVVSANKSFAPNDSIKTGYAYHSAEYATHMFSDENANNCSIM